MAMTVLISVSKLRKNLRGLRFRLPRRTCPSEYPRNLRVSRQLDGRSFRIVNHKREPVFPAFLGKRLATPIVAHRFAKTGSFKFSGVIFL
jgi:hypothetical protein